MSQLSLTYREARTADGASVHYFFKFWVWARDEGPKKSSGSVATQELSVIPLVPERPSLHISLCENRNLAETGILWPRRIAGHSTFFGWSGNSPRIANRWSEHCGNG